MIQPPPSAALVPELRLGRPDEAEAIDALMKAATRDIFPSTYDAEQTAAAIRYIASVDRTLLGDGTYFVAAVDGELVACGGWSRRDKLYTGSAEGQADARLLEPATEPARIRAMFTRADWTRRGLGRRILEACEAAATSEGFTRLALMATMPGVPLYAACGFALVAAEEVRMPNGTTLATVSMEKSIQ